MIAFSIFHENVCTLQTSNHRKHNYFFDPFVQQAFKRNTGKRTYWIPITKKKWDNTNNLPQQKTHRIFHRIGLFRLQYMLAVKLRRPHRSFHHMSWKSNVPFFSKDPKMDWKLLYSCRIWKRSKEPITNSARKESTLIRHTTIFFLAIADRARSLVGQWFSYM